MLLCLNEIYRNKDHLAEYIFRINTYLADWEKRLIEEQLLKEYREFHKNLKPLSVISITQEEPVTSEGKFKQRRWEWNTIQMCN